MRIGSEAPKRRTHSSNRHESQGTCRESATSNRHRYPITSVRTGPKLLGYPQRPPIIVPDAKRRRRVQRPATRTPHTSTVARKVSATTEPKSCAKCRAGHSRLRSPSTVAAYGVSAASAASDCIELPRSATSRHMQCSTTLLFNHLVGAGEQCYRNFDANSFGRFRVDYQLQFRWPLDWQVGRICAFEYLVNERCRS